MILFFSFHIHCFVLALSLTMLWMLFGFVFSKYSACQGDALPLMFFKLGVMLGQSFGERCQPGHPCGI